MLWTMKLGVDGEARSAVGQDVAFHALGCRREAIDGGCPEAVSRELEPREPPRPDLVERESVLEEAVHG